MRLSHGPSGSRVSSLPTRFPVGARYVVEGHGGEDGQLRVISRYVVLPGGRRIKLAADSGELGLAVEPAPRRRRQAPARQASARTKKIIGKKIIGQAGPTKQRRN